MKLDYKAAAATLTDLLSLDSPPLAITFTQAEPAGVARYAGAMPAPTPDGRTGKEAAGCVFWMKAAKATFHTCASDHANCSVGSLTHGFIPLEVAATREDVQAMCSVKWVTPEMFPGIPVIKQKPQCVVYGPLADTPIDPDVVFLRIIGKQAMMLHDAVQDIRFEGKPQCHIIPLAKEHNQIALSVGCMASRTRTGMSNSEMTCAIPVGKLADLLERLADSCAADKAIAAYAAQDARRFAQRAA